MDRFQGIQDFLASNHVEVPIVSFVLHLVLSGVLAIILGKIYVLFGRALSNRREFSKNFPMITMTTMFIITVVKSSLALSLGLVGALSIVRFRAAIKEPEELGYLFLAIAIGLGLGANQLAITLVGFVLIVLFLVVRGKTQSETNDQSVSIQVLSEGADRVALKQVVDVLNKQAHSVKMRRVDESEDSLDANFLVSFDDFSELEKTKKQLQKLQPKIKIQMLDYHGIA